MAAPAVFDAKTHPPTLSYDFTGFARANGEPCTGKGSIPEPSLDALADFLSAAKALESTPLPGRTGGVVLTKRIEGTQADMISAISYLAGGTPTRAELEELPYRMLVAFFRWLADELKCPRVVGL